MILTVSLNPAVDKACNVGEIVQGNVNRLRSMVKTAGGKGINVTRMLRHYDMDVTATGFLGGYAGKYIESEVLLTGAKCAFVHVNGETRTDLNIIADNGYVTEILEPGPAISGETLDIFVAEYISLLEMNCNLVILSGSVPNGVPDNIYSQLIKLAYDRGIKTVLDTSGEALKKGISEAPYLIKPNQKELEYLLGRKLKSVREVAEQAVLLRNKGIAKVVISMGEQGIVCAEHEGVYYCKPPKMDVKNTVASGDCVVASYAMSEIRGDNPQEAIIWATALSAANVTTMENACTPSECVEKLRGILRCEQLDI